MAATLTAGCPGPRSTPPDAASPASSVNPLLVPSSLPYGAPDFTAIRDEHFLPALEQGMAEQLDEVGRIAQSTEPPTFDNTLVALERTGSTLGRVSRVFFHLTSAHTRPSLQEVRAEIAPRLAAHRDAIYLDPALFRRVQSVFDQRDALGLDPESRRLLERTHQRFVRAGAALDDADKARLREINARESELTTAFSDRLLAGTNANAVVVDDVTQLAGLSDADIAAAARAARERGQQGRWALTLQNTTRQPVLAHLQNRDLRERVWRASAERGLTGPHETTSLVLELVRLRAERAQLLGYPNWATFVLEDQMAGTPEAAYRILRDLVPKVVDNATAEQQAIAARMAAEGIDDEVRPWDWAYYAEQVRSERYNLDEAEVRPYFPLNQVFDEGLRPIMERQFGITLQARPDLPVYHPEVQVYEVFDEDGAALGLFYADYFARSSKRGGAWMSSFVDQSGLLSERPVILNVLNVPPPAEGEPALLSFDEVTTLLHEFGHGVHGLFSDVTYPSLSGTAVARDVVEFPSQYQEDWALLPDVLGRYGRHHATGEPLPDDLRDRILAARSFNQGYDSLEYLAAALLDLDWHTLTPDDIPEDVEAFEAASLARHGVDLPAIPPRYRSTYFAHIFAGGYSAGYYAYLWAEVLAADAFAVAQERGGLNRDNGDALRRAVLSVGNSRDPMDSYRDLMGREPIVEPLLRRRGLE